MDDSVSIISLNDSDGSSIVTVIQEIEGRANTTYEALNYSQPIQQLLLCYLFTSHWTDGKLKDANELRLAKKEYLEYVKYAKCSESVAATFRGQFLQKQCSDNKSPNSTVQNISHRSPVSKAKSKAQAQNDNNVPGIAEIRGTNEMKEFSKFHGAGVEGIESLKIPRISQQKPSEHLIRSSADEKGHCSAGKKTHDAHSSNKIKPTEATSETGTDIKTSKMNSPCAKTSHNIKQTQLPSIGTDARKKLRSESQLKRNAAEPEASRELLSGKKRSHRSKIEGSTKHDGSEKKRRLMDSESSKQKRTSTEANNSKSHSLDQQKYHRSSRVQTTPNELNSKPNQDRSGGRKSKGPTSKRGTERKRIARESSALNDGNQNVQPIKSESAVEVPESEDLPTTALNPKVIFSPLKLKMLSNNKRSTTEVAVNVNDLLISYNKTGKIILKKELGSNGKSLTGIDTKNKVADETEGNEIVIDENPLEYEAVVNDEPELEQIEYDGERANNGMVIDGNPLEGEQVMNDHIECNVAENKVMAANEVLDVIMQLNSAKEKLLKYDYVIKMLEREKDHLTKVISEKDSVIEERNCRLADRDSRLKERDVQLQESERKNAEFECKVQALETSNKALVGMLNDHVKDCEDNHRPKPKPKQQKKKTVPQKAATLPSVKIHSPSSSNVCLVNAQQTLQLTPLRLAQPIIGAVARALTQPTQELQNSCGADSSFPTSISNGNSPRFLNGNAVASTSNILSGVSPLTTTTCIVANATSTPTGNQPAATVYILGSPIRTQNLALNTNGIVFSSPNQTSTTAPTCEENASRNCNAIVTGPSMQPFNVSLNNNATVENNASPFHIRPLENYQYPQQRSAPSKFLQRPMDDSVIQSNQRKTSQIRQRAKTLAAKPLYAMHNNFLLQQSGELIDFFLLPYLCSDARMVLRLSSLTDGVRYHNLNG